MPGISDINWLYEKYYSDNPDLRRIVTVHSEFVAKKALTINENKKLHLNPVDIYCASMLHDIGVVKCHAPDIFAFGQLPYLRHGIEGSKILIEANLKKYESVCRNHTGAGITAREIKEKKLPLPPIDMIPRSMLEKLICYSDKFFSKSHDLTKEKSPDEIMSQMKKFGKDSYIRFMELHSMFS